MLRCLFKNTKTLDYSPYPSDWTDFERRLYKDLEHYRMQSHDFLERNSALSKEIKDQEIKFKAVIERLREEKWELEMENEFLRKKVKERL